MRHVTMIQYTGFKCAIASHADDSVLQWVPGKGDYEDNLFCTYYYNGHARELRNDNDELVIEFTGESVLNWSTAWDFPTREIIKNNSTWLCFHSRRPISATYLRLLDKAIVPAGVGAFCALGEFLVDRRRAQVMSYMKPREQDTEITGNAKVLLLHYGNFVNLPINART